MSNAIDKINGKQWGLVTMTGWWRRCSTLFLFVINKQIFSLASRRRWERSQMTNWGGWSECLMVCSYLFILCTAVFFLFLSLLFSLFFFPFRYLFPFLSFFLLPLLFLFAFFFSFPSFFVFKISIFYQSFCIHFFYLFFILLHPFFFN